MKILLVLLLVTPLCSSSQKIVYTIVALCDNECQGIVPVPAGIGDGDDPNSNLYWGCGYGVRHYFDKKIASWTLVDRQVPENENILERCIFEHTQTGTIMIADAYRGCSIKKAMGDYFLALSGLLNESATAKIRDEEVQIELNEASLVCWVGHNGLMDFSLDKWPVAAVDTGKEAIMLACISSEYFVEGVRSAKAYPLLWTRGLMAPEAYTLEAAVSAWVEYGAGDARIEKAAEAAYVKYQGVTAKGSNWLFKTGW